jgi:3-methyladenine DNA glycosylase AlkD
VSAQFLIEELLSIRDEEKAQFLSRFFKTGKGQYAEGDVMLGIVVPRVRDIVKRCPELPFADIQILLDSPYHEARLSGLLLLCRQFKKAKDEAKRQSIFDFYLRNARKVNNWDLVDLSCRDIVGEHLLDKTDRSILYHLAESDNLWEQRIAIVSTWTFIKYGQFDDALEISIKLLPCKHDLIHKATGWMLREVGKKDKHVLTAFLETHRHKMPRTSLRYAIERFTPEEKSYFME